jgi:hypothetical protein
VPDAPFHASLVAGEAVLRFPYDERLRLLLRAIAGRRWDPVERVWRVPLAPAQARALTRLLACVPGEREVTPALTRALTRESARLRPDELEIDVVRPDEGWWISFPTCGPARAVATLMTHERARTVEELGIGLVPLDEQGARLIEQLQSAPDRAPALSDGARRGLAALREPEPEPDPAPAHDVEFRRDRRGRHWLLVAAAHAVGARALARREGLHGLDGPHGSFGLQALERDAEALAGVLHRLGELRIEQRVHAWLTRATSWRGSVEVGGSSGEPAFLLLGDAGRLPSALRERAARVPGGAEVPLTLDSWRVIEDELEAWVSPAARRCAAALAQGRPAPPAVLELSRVHEHPAFVLAPGHDPSCLEAFAALDAALPAARDGRHARDEHRRLPALSADPFCVAELDALIADRGIWVEPAALAALQEIREQHARAAGLVALSAALDADLELPALGGELKPFQRAGVAYLLAQRRAFLADEQGLGKTIEALVALEADEAYPALVLCPASLKLNWLREIERWLPHRTAGALNGTRGGPCEPHDITVVNYDIVAARLQTLAAPAPRALVLDESHYCKNASAKRTQAVQRLAAAVPQDGLVFALSGTPVLNRPAELISQLRILGRLGDFGSGASFSERFRGPDAHQRLHWHLRARCYARRVKADVLPQLPPKTRAVVPVELDNEPEYRLAERDVVAWLQSQPLDLRELDAKVAAALRAERLVRLGALKLLAARGKLHASLAWIHDFCSSGERLVVFAHHREVQQALLERFPHALHILGRDSQLQRQRALDSFQAPDSPHNQLLVCSIEVAGQGITLTRASHVAFLELDWTPAKHDQAEDRCHRIGQRDAVNASYLLAAGTVDEKIAALLEHKRAVVGAVTDGRDEGEHGIVDALVRELRGTPYRHLRAVA